ncbi:MAG: hypothetical protein ACRYFK_12240 [Janthinobacterium lividum]
MTHNSSYGPAAQTPAQRAEVLARMQQALPRLGKQLSPYVQQLHARYLAGELTWLQVCLTLGIEPKGYCAPVG